MKLLLGEASKNERHAPQQLVLFDLRPGKNLILWAPSTGALPASPFGAAELPGIARAGYSQGRPHLLSMHRGVSE